MAGNRRDEILQGSRATYKLNIFWEIGSPRADPSPFSILITTTLRKTDVCPSKDTLIHLSRLNEMWILERL